MATPVREPLNRDRILRAAVAYADEHGIEALSMRKLGQQLGVEAMSLYNHVSNKDDILDGMVDLIFGQITAPSKNEDWKSASRVVAISAKNLFAAHPWFVPLVVSCETLGPAALTFMNNMIGVMRRAGFDAEFAHHTWRLVASHVMGYAFQESTAVWGDHDHEAEVELLRYQLGDQFPHIVELAPHLAMDDPDKEFEFGLDIILDGLEARRQASRV